MPSNSTKLGSLTAWLTSGTEGRAEAEADAIDDRIFVL